MQRIPFSRVAFAGYAGAGKDEAAKILISNGYVRHNFGDIIKRQVNPIVLSHLGFSAFTEDRSLKPKIRRTLESWGEDNYESILSEFVSNCPPFAVNTRLVRAREANSWVRDMGGVIIEVQRPGVGPATNWELERLTELHESGLISAIVVNNGSVEKLHNEVLTALRDVAGVTATINHAAFGKITPIQTGDSTNDTCWANFLASASRATE